MKIGLRRISLPRISRGARRRAGVAGVLAMVSASALGSPARADDKSGVQPTHVILPTGPGSLGGVGEDVAVTSSMGLMTYGIDLDVPAGYAGTTPKLRLAYSSGSGNSEVGIGWSLNVPTIERMTVRVLPSYTGADTFVANGGEELVRVGTTSSYRARFEGSFIRYTWVDTAGTGTRGYWMAEYPDGTVAYFGAKAGGTLTDPSVAKGAQGTFRYYLTEVDDPFGHKVVYDYTKDGALSLLARISYVYEGSAARYTVNFTYGARPDLLSDAKPGFLLQGAKRLTAVTVDVKNVQLRKYVLAYEDTSTSGGLSRLTSVTRYGTGNQGPYPVVFTFAYSGGLGASCTSADCTPKVVSMTGSVGVNLQTGTADLVDMNGDSLPDVVNTGTAAAQFYLNTPTASSHGFADAIPSQQPSSNLALPAVQLADLDGDGFSDLYNAQANTVQWNTGRGDFGAPTSLSTAGVSAPPFSATTDLRFFDYNNDKQIDVLYSAAGSTGYYVNRGKGQFTYVPGTTSIGIGFDSGLLQLADVNGDGLADAVKVSAGTLQYRLYLGWGTWSSWVTMTNMPLGFASPTLHDLNGDGLADLVQVSTNSVSYALNQNAQSFGPITSLVSSDALPFPSSVGATLRFADMNGNGSTDIVWFGQAGQATYLELFPTRPNLITTIDNGIGQHIAVTYGSSVAHMIADGGAKSWSYHLPHAFLTVDQVTTTDALTGVQQTVAYHYANGFYDGLERQFRGYTDVQQTTSGDASVEEGLTRSTYEVGQLDNYRRGLLLTEEQSSGGRLLSTTANTYGDCTVGGIAGALTFPIRYICKQATTRTVVEGGTSDESATIVDGFTYDAYGNVTETQHQGLTSIGSAGCATGIGWGPSGASCLGDEQIEDTTYVPPTNTGGRWILHKPSQKRVSAGGAVHSEENYFYDGAAFQGLGAGALSNGLLTRTQVLANGTTYVDTDRRRYDVNGAVVEVMDANGHHRTIGYDPDGILPISETVHFDDPTHAAYDVKLTATYDPLLEKMVSSSAWTRFDGGQATSALFTTLYAYDPFGRLLSIARPGDTLAAPTDAFTYTMASPWSQVVHARSTVSGGGASLSEAQCFDGRGRSYQKRTQISAGLVQVDGYTVYNAQGETAAQYEPYQATSLACDSAPPAGVLAKQMTYDAARRVLTTTEPDASLFGGLPSVKSTRYTPLATVAYDEEDASYGRFPGTPVITHVDGLGRVAAIERSTAPGASLTTGFGYDDLGHLATIADPKGNVKTQVFDLLGRVVSVTDPDTGLSTMTYDAAGNVLSSTDARGVTSMSSYDEANRTTGTWDAADPAGTLTSYTYDAPGDCPASECANVVGHVASVRYPVPGGTASDWQGYDARSNPTSFARNIDGQSFLVSTSFDNAGRVIGRTYPNGRVVQLALDGLGRTTSVPGLLAEVDYEARGMRSGIIFSGGAQSVYTYDARMRLASATTTLASAATAQPTVAQASQYLYDRVGNVLSISDTATPDGTPSENAVYTYDSLYRLVGASLDDGRAPAETMTFRYDDLDNLVLKSSSLGSSSPDHVGTLAYGINQGPHELTSAGDIAFSYDAAGGLTSRGARVLARDYRGRLTGVQDDGAVTASFAYVSDTTRVKKVEGSHVTYYVGDSYEVRDGAPTVYVSLGAERVARIDGSTAAGAPPSASMVLRGGSLRALAASAKALSGATDAGETVTYLHRSLLGSVTVTSDPTGAIASRAGAYPFGLPRVANEPEADYAFTNMERDDATGFVDFGPRYLDSWTGNWTSADPAFATVTSASQGIGDRFGYASGNPVSRIDPDGFADQPAGADSSPSVDPGPDLHAADGVHLADSARSAFNGFMELATTAIAKDPGGSSVLAKGIAPYAPFMGVVARFGIFLGAGNGWLSSVQRGDDAAGQLTGTIVGAIGAGSKPRESLWGAGIMAADYFTQQFLGVQAHGFFEQAGQFVPVNFGANGFQFTAAVARAFYNNDPAALGRVACQGLYGNYGATVQHFQIVGHAIAGDGNMLMDLAPTGRLGSAARWGDAFGDWLAKSRANYRQYR